MAKRKIVFHTGRGGQNKLALTLVMITVLMLVVVVLIRGSELHKLQEGYDKEIEALQEKIDAESERAEEIEEYRKYTQTDKFAEEVAKDKLGLVYEDETIFVPEE